MGNIKRTVAMILVLIISSLVTIDMAVGAEGDQTSEVKLVAEASNFNITIPTILPVDVNSSGDVTVATNIQLINNSAGPVIVNNVDIVDKNGWTRVGKVSNRVGLSEYTLNVDALDKSIGSGKSTNIIYDSTISPQKEAISNLVMAEVIFTIGWYEEGSTGGGIPPINPGENIVIQAGKESLQVGDSTTVSVVEPLASTEYTFTSSNPAVVSVNALTRSTRSTKAGSTAEITGMGVGAAIITVKDSAGNIGSKNILVIKVELERIEITQAPTKTVYKVGEVFNPAGMIVKAHYNDGESFISSEFSFDKTPIKAGQTSVTISYTVRDITKTVSCPITVEEEIVDILSSISITKQPTKTVYTAGEIFNTTGMEITAHYSSGNSKIITNYTYNNTALNEGQKSVTISYTENGITRAVGCNITVQAASKYILATDAEFSGERNGAFRYIGTAKYVEVPHIIKGVQVNSYANMFDSTSVEGVKSTNTNINSTQNMFKRSKATSLDISELNTSNVTNMAGMFDNSSIIDIDMSHLDTSKVTTMVDMFNNSNAITIDLSNLDTSNVTNMGGMFRNSAVSSIDISGLDTSKVMSMNMMFLNSKATNINISGIDTSNVTNMGSMFQNSRATNLDVSKLNTSRVTNMSNMFNNSATTIIDVSNFDTSKVINMSNMFYNSKSTTLDVSKFVTSSVTDMGNMFSYSQALIIDVSGFDTSKVVTMNDMFSQSQATLIDIRNFNTSNVTNMNNMFGSGQIKDILGLEKIDTSNVTDMSYMFNNYMGDKLDISNFDTLNVTDMKWMFGGCKADILDVSNFDTSNVTDMYCMFQGTSALVLDLSSFKTHNVIDMDSMFDGSSALELDLSGFDTSNVEYMMNLFNNSDATKINVSGFNTSKIRNMEGMFCDSKVKTLDLSSFDTSNVTSMRYMFFETQLDVIDLSSFDTSKLVGTASIFWGSETTIGYARTQEDADRLNALNIGDKPATLNFVVKQ